MKQEAPHPPPVAARDAVLRVERLRKRYGEADVVAGTSFAIRPGECFGLLGPNGAGKTTTLRLALGLIAPESGAIELMGEPVPARAREARRAVGVVPQMDNLDPDFTVAENLFVYGRYFGLPDATIRARLPELLEFAGLAGRAASRIQTLSGGMRRRLMLARALVNDPELLFMDEPTTGLDPQARHVIWDRLRQLLGRGKTILLTTHFMEEAERLCDRVAIMDHGRIIALGTPKELIDSLGAEHVVEFAPEHDAASLEPAMLGELDGVLRARSENGRFQLHVSSLHLAVPSLLAELTRRRVGLAELRTHSATLEDVFVNLTGRHLRDE